MLARLSKTAKKGDPLLQAGCLCLSERPCARESNGDVL